MQKKIPLHINNAMPGAPDLFVMIPELDGEPGDKNETLIKPGNSGQVFLPEKNAIGILVPIKQGEDPWQKLSAIVSKSAAAYVDTLDPDTGDKVDRAVYSVAHSMGKGSIEWLKKILPFKGFTKETETENGRDFFSCENRAIFAANILSQIQLDIVNNNYSAPGRPNCETVIGLLTWSAEDLEPYKTELLEWVNNSSIRDLPVWNGKTED